MSTEGQWQLTGSAAERYERVLAPAIFAPWAADLIELAQLQDGERVLDVACGTGVVARHAAQKVGMAGRVTGLDLNQGMVEVAARSRQFRARHRLHGSRVVHWPCICPTRRLTSSCVSKGFNSFRTDRRPYARCGVCRCQVAGCSSVYGQAARPLITSRCGTPSSGMSGQTRRQRSGRADWARIPRCCGSSWHKQDSGTYRFVFALARPVCQQSPSSCCGTLRPAQWPTQSMRSPTAPGKPSPRRSVRHCGHMVTEKELRSQKRPM